MNLFEGEMMLGKKRRRRPRTEAEIERGRIAKIEAEEARKAQKRDEATRSKAHRKVVAKNGIEYYKSKEAIASLGKAQCASIVAGLEKELAR